VLKGGSVEIVLDDGARRRIALTRAHLEEDAGKSLHEDRHGLTGIDLNRAGTPLLEIVSEPALRSAKEAVAYLKTLRTLLRYLEICDGNMQEGSLRCDANVSLRPRGSDRLGTRAEIKNLNSFRFVEKAIHHEIERQRDLLEAGGRVPQETRLYDPDRDETRPMRSKEEANDYRYFPDPDLLPLEIDAAFIEAVRRTLPELPEARRQRFEREYALCGYDAAVLTGSRDLADYYEGVVRELGGETKTAANWVMGELAGALNRENLEIGASRVDARRLAGLLKRVGDGTISGKIAKEVFDAMWGGEGGADEIIARRGLEQITDDTAIAQVVDATIAAYPMQAERYRAGKTALYGFFVGQVMKATGGKANPQKVNAFLRSRLDGPGG
jgi:aspartyl-tRNA(Asn)/glutamyl-tRNA(Gln) amidotransferase subunit B